MDNEPYVWDEGEGRVLPARSHTSICHMAPIVFVNVNTQYL